MKKPKSFSRPTLLMLAILCYKWDGVINSASGSARKLLYDELYSLFPDAYGAKLGHRPRIVEKVSVLRGMRDAGLILLQPNGGHMVTKTIQILPPGSRHLRQGLADPRYHDDLLLIRDYYKGDPEDSPVSQPWTEIEAPKVITPKPKPLVEVLAPQPMEDEGAEIAVAPDWDTEPVSERVGWALLTGGENWEVVGDDMIALIDAINACMEVRAIYPLTVANALPPRN